MSRFFFMHLGSFVAVFLYIALLESAGVAPALWIALGAHTAYAALARWHGEHKHFDLGIWLLFALGAVSSLAGVEPVVALYRRYFGVLLFGTLALTALIPLLLGRETFTYYFARRQMPAWQLRMPVFDAISRVMTGWWVFVFTLAAAFCAARPADWRFTLLLPNLAVFLLGMPAAVWLPALYTRLLPPPTPEAIEPLILGMPSVFDRRAAADARATIQFHVSGAEAGDYHLRIAGGRCESAEGLAKAPDLVVRTPDTVWKRIARGELDGGQALAGGLYAAEGDLAVLTKLSAWFPPRRAARRAARRSPR